jgi:hypothetical protein
MVLLSASSQPDHPAASPDGIAARTREKFVWRCGLADRRWYPVRFSSLDTPS